MYINTDDYVLLVIVDGKIISYIKSAVAGEDENEETNE